MTQPQNSSEEKPAKNDDNLSVNEIAEEAAKTGQVPQRARQRFFIAIAILAISASFGNIALKYGLSGDRAPSLDTLSFGSIWSAAIATLGNIWVDLAIILLITEFIAMIYAMRYAPISLVIPLKGAAIYIFSAFLAQVFLNEEVTLMRWMAIVVILVGVGMVGISGGDKS